jgi:Undecaprenyl-phosphate galactose phosphotransferase WbaP
MSAAAAPAISTISNPAISFKRWATLSTIVLADAVALFAANSLAILTRYACNGQFNPSDYWVFAPMLGLFLSVFAISGLYPGIAINAVDEFGRILRATSITYLLIISATFLTKRSADYSRVIFLLAWALSLFLLLALRPAVRRWAATKSWWGVPTVILGAGSVGQAMCTALQGNPSFGLRPVALLDEYISDYDLRPEIAANCVVGSLSLARQFVGASRYCYAIVARPDLTSPQIAAIISNYAADFPHVLVIPDVFGLSSLWVSAKEVGGMLGFEVRQTLVHRVPRFAKRTLDLVMASAVAVAASPVFALLYLSVIATSAGSAFYGQRRIGCDGRVFTAWKFRTMHPNADGVLDEYLAANPEMRLEWERDQKLRKDPRVTAVGRFLRKTSLDELPQLWNVLRGEMSLVGPRPIVGAEIVKYGERFTLYKKVRPGITGLWQISGRNDTTYQARTEFDEYYVRNWSVSLDLYILLRTVKTVLRGEGAY